MKRMRVAGAGLLLLMTVLAAACGSEPTPTPSPTPSPTATATATPSPTPTTPPTPTGERVPTPGTTMVVLQPSKDTTLYERLPLASSGTGDYLFIGMTNGREKRRALLAFDVAAGVPEGATIATAWLGLAISRSQADPQPVSVHRMASGWTEGSAKATEFGQGGGTDPEEGDVTWEHRSYPDQTWDNPGGDFAAEPSATATMGTPQRGTVLETIWGPTDRMVADVQAWLDDPSMNHGWVVIGNEEQPQTTKRVESRENVNEANRPALTIEYFPPG